MNTKRKVEERVTFSSESYRLLGNLLLQSKLIKRFFRYVFFEVCSAAGMILSFGLYAFTDKFVFMILFAAFFLFNGFCSLAKFWQVSKLAWSRK